VHRCIYSRPGTGSINEGGDGLRMVAGWVRNQTPEVAVRNWSQWQSQILTRALLTGRKSECSASKVYPRRPYSGNRSKNADDSCSRRAAALPYGDGTSSSRTEDVQTSYTSNPVSCDSAKPSIPCHEKAAVSRFCSWISVSSSRIQQPDWRGLYWLGSLGATEATPLQLETRNAGGPQLSASSLT